MFNSLVPWDSRIKRVESYFGSSVSSFFTLLRKVSTIHMREILKGFYGAFAYGNLCKMVMLFEYLHFNIDNRLCDGTRDAHWCKSRGKSI